jgi:hypothetical protein
VPENVGKKPYATLFSVQKSRSSNAYRGKEMVISYLKMSVSISTLTFKPLTVSSAVPVPTQGKNCHANKCKECLEKSGAGGSHL